jgi:hypothetical protein
MADNIGSLAVQLSLDALLFSQGLDKSTKEGAAFAASITKTFAGIGAGVAVGGSLVDGAKGLYDAYKSGLHEIVETGEEVHKLGTSFEGLAALQLLAGSDAERMTKSFEHLSAKLAEMKIKGGDATAPLDALHLKLSDLADKPFEQKLGLIVDKIQALGDASDRNYFAKELLGLREGPAIVEKIKEGTLGIADAVAQIKSHGNILNEKDFESALAAEKSIKEMESTFNRIKLSLISEFAPVMKNVADGVADMTGKANGKDAFKGLGDAAKEFLKGLTKGLIIVSKVIGGIVDDVQAAVAKLPQSKESSSGLTGGLFGTKEGGFFAPPKGGVFDSLFGKLFESVNKSVADGDARQGFRTPQ